MQIAVNAAEEFHNLR